MFKKVTTTVVEEHAPLTAGAPTTVVNPYSPDAVRLKLDIRDRMAQYASDMRNYVVSKCNNTEDVPEIAEQVRVNGTLLVVTMQPYFNNDQLVEFNSSLAETIKAITSVVNVLATNQEFASDVSNARLRIEHMATVLDKLGVMLANRTTAIWYAYLTLVQQQVTSRLQKKWKQEQDLYTQGHNLLVLGQLVPPPNNSMGFADLLTEGILNKNLI